MSMIRTSLLALASVLLIAGASSALAASEADYKAALAARADVALAISSTEASASKDVLIMLMAALPDRKSAGHC